MFSKEEIYWVWLAEQLGADSPDFRKLYRAYQDPYEIFRMDENELEKIPEIGAQARRRLANKDLKRASEILDACEQIGIRILRFGDPKFPQQLAEIQNPPCLLYYAGDLPDYEHRFTVGMVGTRQMSDYGMHNAYRLAYELSRAGALTVSGLAEGIDGVCAAATIEAGGKTTAIIGCGLDIAYPKHHGKLMYEIVRSGGVILSEYPPGTPPRPYHFPVRNRLISGFSHCIIVVEARIGSGSLITAKAAIMQGKEVYALPANVGTSAADGANQLLQDGAKFLMDTKSFLRKYRYLFENGKLSSQNRTLPKEADLEALERYGVIRKDHACKKVSKPSPEADPLPKQTAPVVEVRRTEPKEPIQKQSGSAIEQAILGAMPEGEAVSADALQIEGYSLGEILAALTTLELEGSVRKLPGSLYRKR